MEQVYQYLTGMKFRQRVEAVIEKFDDMPEDLDRERKFMGKQWSKREAQILAVVDSTVGMVGDLQGIAGEAMPEIPSLDMPLLEAATDQEATYRDWPTSRGIPLLWCRARSLWRSADAHTTETPSHSRGR